MLLYMQRGEPAPPFVRDEDRAELARLITETMQKTGKLVEDHWPAIQRVAAALHSDQLNYCLRSISMR
jgi:hypothetical protein